MNPANPTPMAIDDGNAVLHALLSHGPSIVFVIDTHWRICSINRIPPGLDRADVLGTSCLDYVPADSHSVALQAFEQVLRTGQPTRYEIRARGADDTVAWYLTQVLPLGTDASHLLLVSDDITERRLAEAELASSEERLRRSEALLKSIVESTSDAVFVKDQQGCYLLVNGAFCGLVGRTAADLLGRDAGAFLPPEAARALKEGDHDVMVRGGVVTVSETVDWAGDERRNFLTTKGPLLDEHGQVVGMFGIAREVTQLMRQDEAQRKALQESRDMLDLALAGAELGTWDTDMSTGRSRYGARYLAMLGYGPGELAPTMQGWLQLIHPDDRPAVDEAIAAHARGETRVYEAEHRLRHKDGHWVWVLARGKMLRDATGKPVRAVGTHQDITDRKRMTSEGTVLLRKIEALIAGLDPRASVVAQTPHAASPEGGFKVRLSARHREVLALLAAGHTAAEVAQRLGITKDTANTHRRDLMRKLGLRNKAELIRYAIENGIGKPDGMRHTP